MMRSRDDVAGVAARAVLRSNEHRLAGILFIGALMMSVIGVVRFVNAPVSVRVADGELYESIAQLTEDSDLVATVQIGQIVSRYDDYAGDPHFDERGDPIPPLRKAVYEASVLDVLKGDRSRRTVFVVLDDIGDNVVDGWTPRLKEGDRLVVFLFDVKAEGGSLELREQDQAFGGLFGIVGGNQGVFDAAGDIAVSRGDTIQLRIGLEESIPR